MAASKTLLSQGTVLNAHAGLLTQPLSHSRSPECDCSLCLPGSTKGPASHNPNVRFRECVICEESCPESYGNAGRVGFTCDDCLQRLLLLKP
jgi:hypothetical protein